MRTPRIVLRVLCLAGCAFLVSLTGCSAMFYPLEHVAFMGDSITAFWSLPVINLGVPGNTTAQMLARFPAEVTGHGYRAVVILGGINDIDHNGTPEHALANIQQMAQIARDAHMDVVLCELTPNFQNNSVRDPKIRVLNGYIEQLALEQHYTLVDYYDPMAGHPEYFGDGLHPNQAGYAVMEQVLLPVMRNLLGT